MTLKNTDKIRIEVRNEQTDGDMRDTVCENGSGTYREKDGVLYVTYKTDAATVLIKAQDDMVTVRRTGDAASEIKYRLDKRTYFEYKTQYGTFSMSVFTRDIKIRTDEIKLDYVLETSGDEIFNNMTIKIRGINK